MLSYKVTNNESMYLCRVPEREAVVHAGEQEGGGEEGPHHLEQRAEGNGGA